MAGGGTWAVACQPSVTTSWGGIACVAGANSCSAASLPHALTLACPHAKHAQHCCAQEHACHSSVTWLPVADATLSPNNGHTSTRVNTMPTAQKLHKNDQLHEQLALVVSAMQTIAGARNPHMYLGTQVAPVATAVLVLLGGLSHQARTSTSLCHHQRRLFSISCTCTVAGRPCSIPLGALHMR